MLTDETIEILESMCRARGAVAVEVPAVDLARLLDEVRRARHREEIRGHDVEGVCV